MGNAEKRRKRSKAKSKQARIQKTTMQASFGDVKFQEETLEVEDYVIELFKTLPPSSEEYKAVPLIDYTR